MTASDFELLLADLEAESVSLRRLLAGVPLAAWSTPTPSAGWDIHDQIGHIAFFDEHTAASVDDPDGFRAEVAARRRQPDDISESIITKLRSLPTGEMLGRLVAARTGLIETYRRHDPRERVPWYGPEMSVMSSATARLMETWAHGVDVADALSAPLESSSRLRHIAHLGARTFGFTFTNHGLAVPPSIPRVSLTTSDGSQWAAGPAAASESITGPMLDFCLVVTQRRHVSETALVVSGPTAVAWMDVAQAFAGPATVKAAP